MKLGMDQEAMDLINDCFKNCSKLQWEHLFPLKLAILASGSKLRNAEQAVEFVDEMLDFYK